MAGQDWWTEYPEAKGGNTGAPLQSPPRAPDEPNITYRQLTPEEAAERGLPAHTRYQIGSNGSVSAISGAKPAAALRQGDSDKLRAAVDQFTSFTNVNDAFVDDYGGNWAGSLENTAQRYSPVEVGTPGQAEWWAGVNEIDNIIRNNLFGASLTQGEKQAYARTTISPGMRADQIRANLERREEIMRGALARYVNGLKAGGWNEQEIDALVGEISPRLFPDSAPQSEEDDTTPPALGAARAGGGGSQPPAPDAPPGDAPPPLNGPGVNSEGQIAGNTHTGGDDNPQEIARGEYRREDNPLLAGVRAEYTHRLERGDSAGMLVAFLRGMGVNPDPATVQAQVTFRAEHPEIAMGEYDTSQLDDMFVAQTPLEMQRAEDADTAVGAFLINAGDAFSGFNLDSLAGAGGHNEELTRLAIDEIGERHPIASTLGTISGGVGAALGAEGALGFKMAPGVLRAMLADTAYGAAAGAGATDYADDGSPATVADRFTGAGKGALAGAAGSYIGSKAAGAMHRTARGVTDTSVRTMIGEGVPLTVGQAYSRSGRVGRMVKGVEDRLAGLPVVGDMINARRAEGLERFGTGAFDKALEPIGGTVSGAIGEEAVERAQEQVSQAFTDALAGKGATADLQFQDDITNAVLGVRSIKRIGPELDDEVGDILAPYMEGNMLSGEALDDISRNLRELKGRYRLDPLGNRAAKQIDRVERAIFDLFDRQAGDTIPAYTAARAAYRRLSVLEDSVLAAKNTEGVFTPAQLGHADRRNAIKYGGRRAAARGEGVFHDYQRAAQDVLPGKVPDSGTAGRAALIPLAMVGAGGASDATGATPTGTGLTIGAILAALYTKGGQRVLTKPGRGMNPGTRRRAVLESSKTKRAISAAAGSGGAALATQQ